MIEWLNEWAQGIIVAVIIATIIELILPKGNSKKYVKVIVGIYILFTIISPVIAKVKGNELNVNEILDTKKFEKELEKSNSKISEKLESNNSRSIKDIYVSNLTTDIKNKLKEKGYNVVSSSINVKDDKNYTIEEINLEVNKIENEQADNQENEQEVNKIESINIEKVKIRVDTDNTMDNTEENKIINKNTLTEEQKHEIKEYLSTTYNIDIKNIILS